MSDVTKDPAIKLFGKTIQLPDEVLSTKDRPFSPNTSAEENKNGFEEDPELDKNLSGEKVTDTKEEDGTHLMKSEGFTDPNPTSVIDENPKTPSFDNEAVTGLSSKNEEQSGDSSNSQEKTLKKPDKIIPCPRCNSMDTKFCYYNNYNVNQPRHFCKNCQRYWTAGGTMRNVPVGAGRRKNKNSTSHYRHVTVSEVLQGSRVDQIDGTHHQSVYANGTVLTFGPDTPLCESMASVLKIAKQTKQNELRPPVSYGFGRKMDDHDHSSGSSVNTANSKDEAGRIGLQDPRLQNSQNYPPQLPCFPGAPWSYPWSSAQWTPPNFCPSGFPMPFYPASPYWGCTVPGSWNVQWITPPTPPQGPNSRTLGKHSRDDDNVAKSSEWGREESQKENNLEKSLWFPKTLRIADPGEAARSSILATLGIKNDKAESVPGGGLFKALQSKGDEKNHVFENSPVLQANPAALSRSVNFRESS